MHWECLGYTVLTFIVGYCCGALFGEPRSAADPAEDGVRGCADECACCEACTCTEANEKLPEMLRRRAPWEEF
jgi:hypothetical protein